ncbi:right-handed parallel beta-helix repeat-containing protein [Plantactinospora sp. BC1]|uniref:right-handed parallel beta-helix repeat-containing protein n=1 Tax=Plantactinospora sp. BC1 TaxID=2108470 RepID=UPI0018FEAAE7|nr:right-handed parallel beta-helix repeat-containing protein [Plantactinospora sp. BC1]
MKALVRLAVAGMFLLLGLASAAPAAAHDERQPVYPDGTGSVPAYRTDGPRLLVCKTDAADFTARIAGFPAELRTSNQALYDECQRSGYRHLQDAVDAARLPGTRILMLPGVYREEPSLAPPAGACAELDAPWSGNRLYQVMSYEQQVACPHVQNLVAVIGKRDLQIEGTGAGPLDVMVDAQYQKLNAIRADRANGFYLRNLTAQRTTFNAVYILETDGFVIDRAIGRWNDEYGFLTFADDHGLYTGCEAYGNGDSGVYPGAASNINADRGHQVDRYAIEITGCKSHHNLLGYSGTAGDSVWAHDNEFTNNAAGVATDSAFPDHPGMPQNHAKFERNVIGDNNEDYYRYVRDGTCAKPYAERGYEDGVVCPAVGLPPGTGVINPGGNYNIWRDNWVFGHAYAGFVTSWVPGFVRGDTGFAAQFDTSHHNRYLGNRLGVRRDGTRAPNGMDFWWDGQGRGSCWQRPAAGAEPRVLPACGADEMPAGLGVNRAVAEPGKTLKLYVCADYSLSERRIPAGCDWFGARGLDRIEVRAATGEAVLLGVLILVLWARLGRRDPLWTASSAVALAGLVVGVFGTAYEGTWLTSLGLALLGVGWLGVGWSLRRTGRRGLGWLTLALGVFALLGAVDRGLVMLPGTPVGPVWPRILLELVWVPWVAVRSARSVSSTRRAPAGADRSPRHSS